MQNVFLFHEIYMLGYDANWIYLFAQNISRASNPTYKCYLQLLSLVAQVRKALSERRISELSGKAT
jgi:hypothetical protein